LSAEKVLEVTLFVLGMAGIVFLLQVEYFSVTIQRALPFLILPFFLWLAFRFPLIVAMGGICIASLLAIYFTIGNEGPFLLSDPYSSVLLLQIFIAVMSISTLVLSATVKERSAHRLCMKKF
jgi:integral membrane sensor domain MASE1